MAPGRSDDVFGKRQTPLAVIGAPRLPEQLIHDLRSFAAEVAPDVAIGIIDLDGSRIFVGPEIEALSSFVARPKQLASALRVGPRPHLFSDLNQWMLKVLLAPRISERLLRAPREPIRNVSDLARVSRVSLMSAFRCVNLLRAEGFVDDQSDVLRLVNIEVLLNRWRAASAKPAQDVPMRWIIPGASERQLFDAVQEYLKKREVAISSPRRRSLNRGAPPALRLCLGLFAAADALGFGFVRGVASHLYFERFDQLAFEQLGLIAVYPGQRADVFIRIPQFRESVFRAAVVKDGIPVSDVLQVWLDVADHPSRGSRQAKEIWQRVLAPLRK